MGMQLWRRWPKLTVVSVATVAATSGLLVWNVGGASASNPFSFAMRMTTTQGDFVMRHITSIDTVASPKMTELKLDAAQPTDFADATTSLGSAPTQYLQVTKTFGSDDKAAVLPSLLANPADRHVTKVVWAEKVGSTIVDRYRAPSAWLVGVNVKSPPGGKTGPTVETITLATSSATCYITTRAVPTPTVVGSGGTHYNGNFTVGTHEIALGKANVQTKAIDGFLAVEQRITDKENNDWQSSHSGKTPGFGATLKSGWTPSLNKGCPLTYAGKNGKNGKIRDFLGSIQKNETDMSDFLVTEVAIQWRTSQKTPFVTWQTSTSEATLK
jgi:hypothetical protein